MIHDDYDWHIHATSDDAPLATRILVEAAMAFVDVIRSDEYDRVRVCSADDCDSRLHRLLAQRLEALLRHRQLRQPHERHRVPGAEGARKRLIASAAGAGVS